MPSFIDLTGSKIGRWHVIDRAMPKEFYVGAYWNCVCDCGNKRTVSGSALRRAKSLSCGCLQKEIAAATLPKTSKRHGMSKSRLYVIWLRMRCRCCDAKDSRYSLYGGRGIKICQEWSNDFEAFRVWAIAAGYDENAPYGKCTIERVNNDGDYEPSNCRWASIKEQCNNKRNNHILSCFGETKTIAQWAAEYGFSYHQLWKRIWRGWSAEKALNTPVTQRGKVWIGGHCFSK